ncbi:GPP34 family phosphoprotein [Nonomuraea sp. NPDC050310]|uniref:GOLPH3/VPS74 family protein n=1 Tax=Nonomuraea sp. NPDC050310 TaxID=3154935 RepID=UPI00340378B2
MARRRRTAPGESLAESVFLLAFDVRKQRLAGLSDLGYVVRAAVLAEFLLNGNVADEGGKVRPLTPPVAPTALEAAVWEQLSASPPRSWSRWINKNATLAYRLVRDELVAARLVHVEHRRILFFPVQRVTPRRPYVSRRLAERVTSAARGGQPVGRLPQELRALAALAAAAKMTTVLSQREWRQYRKRTDELSAPIEPITTALRKTLASHHSSDAAG